MGVTYSDDPFPIVKIGDHKQDSVWKKCETSKSSA